MNQDSGWELHKVPKSTDDVEYCKPVKQDSGVAAAWIDSKKFAILDKNRMVNDKRRFNNCYRLLLEI